MPPRTTRAKTPFREPDDREKILQGYLDEAYAALEKAKLVADEIGITFDFLDRTYSPKVTQTIVTGGGWNDEDSWMHSSC